MKTHIVTILAILGALLSPVSAQKPANKKPPVGIPTDATLFNGKWYRIYLEQANWERAKERCASLGGQLAIVPDAPTWAFLQPMTKGLLLWLGATDEKTEGLWKWIDGTPVTLNAWHKRQPDNRGGAQNHLVVVGNWWDDRNKFDKTVGFICEWKDK